MTIGKLNEAIEEINHLYQSSNFSDGKFYEWSGIFIDDDDGHIYVPAGATLGETCIEVDYCYENCGYDALVIQKLLQKWPSIYNALKDQETDFDTL